MVKMNLDNLVQKTLMALNVAKQDRIAASGNLTGLPPTILSQERRLPPSSCSEPEPGLWSSLYGSTYRATTAKRAGRLSASGFGFLARRGARSTPARLIGSLATIALTAPVTFTTTSVGSDGTTAVHGRVDSEERNAHRVPVDHDHQSHDRRDAMFQTFTGQQPVRGMTRTLIRGK